MKLLLIKRGALGDVLMTTPLIRQLRANNKDAQIDYCISKACAATLKDNPYIDNIISLDDLVFSARGIIKLFKFLVSIRKKYDYIFILGKNWQVNLLCKITGSRLVGFAREKISKLLLNKFVLYNDVSRYQVLYYLDLLQCSGLGTVDYSDIKMDLQVSITDKLIVNKELKLLDLGKFIVITNSGGNNQFEHTGIRMLPEDKILLLLEKVSKLCPIILLGSAIEEDIYNSYIQTLRAYDISNIINFSGKLSISQSVHLLSLAESFYVTDCGAMHFGLIAGIEGKMTCLFGPTCPWHILPKDTKCNVVWTDQDIFDESYQLYGKIKKNNKYFTKINIKI
ncbi:MAG: glycosyltransferase family 9 protein [Neisseriaceae bacterium]